MTPHGSISWRWVLAQRQSSAYPVQVSSPIILAQAEYACVCLPKTIQSVCV